MIAMKTYKWLRGLLKASAFATVMFVMQACYGAPHPMDDPDFREQQAQLNDTSQDMEEAAPMEVAE